jgi:hypothetical protein
MCARGEAASGNFRTPRLVVPRPHPRDLHLVITATLIVWLLIAFLACAVAPDDRPWHFFWCTFLLLGPVGVAVALLAQPLNYST